jgi:acyl-CoA synthetase (AMP-forming)/AMP-acid ligase II
MGGCQWPKKTTCLEKITSIRSSSKNCSPHRLWIRRIAKSYTATDNLLPHDGQSTGEVVMRSPWLTAGYFKEPEKSKELWRNG